ncbi:uncharacterized protein LOC135495426 [Lineus longissimus]|uniref:uncharacterized protein LOC135495426 n=1 Tax=Lineus longissimus TaxID=88925 RepID=UPI002B4DBDBE
MRADHFPRCHRWLLCQMRYPLNLFFVCLLLMTFALYRYQSGQRCRYRDNQTSQGKFPLRSITSGSVNKTRLNRTVDQPTVVVLSLLHNSEPSLEDFKFLVETLTYPHELISVVFGEDGSKDGTVLKAKQVLSSLTSEFRRVDFHHFDLGGQYPWDLPIGGDPKHRASVQKERRRHLALARNMLLTNGLGDEDWVLWIDSDIIKTPPDIIEQMLATKKDIVAPRCMYKPNKDEELLYDRNTWQDTDASRKYKADPGILFLEGYNGERPPKLNMDQLKDRGVDLVEVDSVGGCVLLIKAIHHQQGLVFPPYIYKHYIETEGLSKIAQAMGLKLWAMPRLTVYHYHSGTDPAFYKRNAVRSQQRFGMNGIDMQKAIKLIFLQKSRT